LHAKAGQVPGKQCYEGWPHRRSKAPCACRPPPLPGPIHTERGRQREKGKKGGNGRREEKTKKEKEKGKDTHTERDRETGRQRHRETEREGEKRTSGPAGRRDEAVAHVWVQAPARLRDGDELARERKRRIVRPVAPQRQCCVVCEQALGRRGRRVPYTLRTTVCGCGARLRRTR
jgi:hypothetical protein